MGKLLFLGTGGSTGVPLIGCSCEVCLSSSPKNKRLRTSALVTVKGKNFLIDVGPDFREQALTHKIHHLDGVLLTHPHFDHVGGVDDLRAYYFIQQKKIPCLLSQETFEEVKIRYHYLMRPLRDGHSVCAQLDFFLLEKEFGEVDFCAERWGYMSYSQAGMKVTGFRLGNMAYVSDIRTYTDQLFCSLEGIEVLVLSALRHVPTEMHFSLDEAISFTQRVRAKKTYLTHLSHDLEHDLVDNMLPDNVQLGYDGLKIDFKDS